MSKIIPFKALLPKKERAEKIISPPYDVVTTDEAREFAKGNEYSFLHITRSEIDLPSDTPPYEEKVYKKACENFELFKNNGWLWQDCESFYVYRQIMGNHVQTGLVCLVPVADYLNGRIKKHELTREEKVLDRAKHIETLNAFAEPVFLVYPHNGKIEEIIKSETRDEPLINVKARDGVTHILWRAEHAKEIESAFEEVDSLYIADGHHRSESAGRVGRDFPVVIFPDNEVKIYEYNWQGDPQNRPLSKYSMKDVMKLADGGGIMPPKSTWFAPKLASGLFVHKF